MAEIPTRTSTENANFLGTERHILYSREGRAYLKELPNTEMHRLDSGHFAVEDCLDEITNNINRFYLEKVVKIPA